MHTEHDCQACKVLFAMTGFEVAAWREHFPYALPCIEVHKRKIRFIPRAGQPAIEVKREDLFMAGVPPYVLAAGDFAQFDERETIDLTYVNPVTGEVVLQRVVMPLGLHEQGGKHTAVTRHSKIEVYDEHSAHYERNRPHRERSIYPEDMQIALAQVVTDIWTGERVDIPAEQRLPEAEARMCRNLNISPAEFLAQRARGDK